MKDPWSISCVEMGYEGVSLIGPMVAENGVWVDDDSTRVGAVLSLTSLSAVVR
jgi:hypothetical protein